MLWADIIRTLIEKENLHSNKLKIETVSSYDGRGEGFENPLSHKKHAQNILNGALGKKIDSD